MTSANVTDYRIFDATGKQVGKHSQHALCKTHWEKLLVFEPLDQHTIQAHGLDEEEASWEDKPVNLRHFLLRWGVIERLPTDPPSHVIVFDGSKRSKVPYCCKGAVKLVWIGEARAHPNMLEEMQKVESYLACVECGRRL